MNPVPGDAAGLTRLTGLSAREFRRAHRVFDALCRAAHGERTVNGRPRRRDRGAGLSGPLHDPAAMLFFVLLYHHLHPSQKAMGQLFGMTQQWASAWIRHLTPMAAKALGRKLTLTPGKPLTLGALLLAAPGLPSILHHYRMQPPPT